MFKLVINNARERNSLLSRTSADEITKLSILAFTTAPLTFPVKDPSRWGQKVLDDLHVDVTFTYQRFTISCSFLLTGDGS